MSTAERLWDPQKTWMADPTCFQWPHRYCAAFGPQVCWVPGGDVGEAWGAGPIVRASLLVPNSGSSHALPQKQIPFHLQLIYHGLP